MGMGRREQFIVLVILAALIFGSGYKIARLKTADGSGPTLEKAGHTKTEEVAKATVPQKAAIFVHVDGAVQKPGLYELPAGSRVNDAVSKAVPRENADLGSLNLAEKLSDGQKVTVAPKVGKAGGTPQAEAAAAAGGGVGPGQSGGALQPGAKVNINTASQGDLDSLPGIGPALANRIIDYRLKHGSFKNVKDLKKVPGIGDKKFADLKDLITN